MSVSIRQFSEALQLTEEHLRTLRGCEVVINLDGRPALHRSSTMVEAEIRIDGQHYLLAMPLNETIGNELERRLSALTRLRHRAWAELRVLHDELVCTDPMGRKVSTTLYLQRMAGEPLDEVIEELEPQRLNRALDTLNEELAALRIAHNNLKAENLRWDNDHLVVLRPWHATLGGNRTADLAALETLRRATEEAESVNDYEAPYEAEPKGFWCGHEFEGLICYQEEHGFGYRDRSGQVVIAPQYLWADDFHEGRAVVETTEGMGLIDRTGRFILEPHYEIVEYLYAESVVWARKNGLWASFDITGARTSPFMERDNAMNDNE